LCVAANAFHEYCGPATANQARITNVMKHLKIIIEKHADGYVAYPVGIQGVVVGQGDSYEAALNDVKSAIKFHLESFGPSSLDADEPVMEAFVAEATV
jgi:predicted RNase H-like HicB family nuclease